MKRGKLLLMSLLAVVMLSSTAYAGQWKQDSTGWWYQNDDGSYPVSEWKQIDGKWYYFHSDGMMAYNTWVDDCYLGNDGAMYVNTTTPDGQTVDGNGKKIPLHSVSNISYTSDSITNALTIRDWIYDVGFGSTYHIFEITNNSPYTLNIGINEIAKDSNGSEIGADSTEGIDIPSGQTVFINNYFSNVDGIKNFDTTIQTKQEQYYIPVIQNVSVEVTDLGNKVLVKATNNGTESVEFVEATAVFFNGNQVVDYDSTYLVDNDYELKPGASISEQLDYYNFDDIQYDSVRVHLTGRKSVW